jgi:hypothetical protein
VQAPARPYVLASAALVATGVVSALAAPPIARWVQPPTRSVENRLVDVEVSGIEAIPFNLFSDIVDIPGNEVDAFQGLGNSLMDGGTWLVASATNLFGEDPGDPSRFMALTQMLIPFTAISGEGSPEPGYIDPSDPTGPTSFDWADAASGQLGLSQQISLLLDSEIPVSASSDGTWSAPLDPVSPITGFDGIDRAIWTAEIFTFQTPFPLIDNWFQTPLSELTGGTYNFGTVVDPSAGVGANGQVPTDSVWGLAGTHPEMGDMGYGVNALGETLNANGNVVQLMPWSNESFTFNPLYPFENFFSSNPGGLEAPVDTTTFLNDLNIPTGEELFQAIQTFVAGSVISFDPLVPGSPLCDPVCAGLPDSLSMPALVQDVENWDPSNTSIQHWLDLYHTPSTGPGDLPNPYGSTADPTQEQINFANITNNQSMFDFGNPQTTDPQPPGIETPINFGTSQSIQELQNFFQTSGLYNLVHEYALSQGYTPIDWANPDVLLQPTTSTATGAASEALAANGFDPSQFTADVANVFDPSQFTVDLSQLLGSSLSTDLSQMLATELPQLLGAQLSTDVLSLF